jgi:hypothetical protein
MVDAFPVMAASMTSWCFMVSKVVSRDPANRETVNKDAAPQEPRQIRRIRLANREFVFTVELPLVTPLWRDARFGLMVALTLFALAPFTLPGYFWGANDARHHVYFLFEYDRLVADGVWWPRWSPDFAFGYGYPFFNIYGPFSHLVAELFHHLLGFGYTAAIEIVFGLSIIGSAVAMYLYVRSWLGSGAALVAALVYLYAPYHLLNLYVRANLAESMAFVWLPLCLWTVRMATIRPGWPWVAGLAASYAGLMLTSNLVIVLFTPFLLAYALLCVLIHGTPDHAGDLAIPLWIRLRLWLHTAVAPLLGGLAGLGLSALFWLPAFTERQYVRVDQWFGGRYDFRGNFVYFYQLFSPQWGFGVSQSGPDDTFGFQLGVVPVVFACLGLLLARRLGWQIQWESGLLVVGVGVSTLLTLQLAAPLWELPLLGSILQAAQFPWRWFSITVLCLSPLAGLLAHPAFLHSKTQLTLPLVALAGVIVLSSYPYLRVEIREPAEGPVSLAGLMRFQQSSDEMTGSTAWVAEIPQWSPMADYYINQAAAGQPVLPVTTKVDYGNPTWPIDYKTFGVQSLRHNTIMEEVYFGNTRTTEQRIVFNHFYYPGWKAYLLDGQHGAPVRELPIIPEETGTLGRMTVPVPTGEGYLLLRYENTPPRTIGEALSLATAAILGLAGLWWMRKRT